MREGFADLLSAVRPEKRRMDGQFDNAVVCGDIDHTTSKLMS